MTGRVDKNCITWWLPRIEAAGVPSPKTVIIPSPDNYHELLGIFDGPGHPESHAKGIELLAEVSNRIAAAVAKAGLTYPLFLKTGDFSGKHNWNKTCHVPSEKSLPGHVTEIVMMAEMFMGPNWKVWAARELLPVRPVTHLPGYGGMPLVREVRCFVRDGSLLCAHEYWPVDSIATGLRVPGWKLRELGQKPEPPDAVRARAFGLHALLDPLAPPYRERWEPIALQAADAFHGEGEFSLDLLETDNGWFVTDCAEGPRSWHHPECARIKK